MKKRPLSRMLSGLLTVFLLAGSAFPNYAAAQELKPQANPGQDSGVSSYVEERDSAAVETEQAVLQLPTPEAEDQFESFYRFAVQNAGFENKDDVLLNGVAYEDYFKWFSYGASGQIIEDPSVSHSGNNCAYLYTVGDTWEQPLENLKPNGEYVFRVWCKTEPGVTACLRVMGSQAPLVFVSGEEWTLYEQPFTADQSGKVRIGFVQWAEGDYTAKDGGCWVDDASVVPVEKSVIDWVGKQSTTQTVVQFSESYSDIPTAEDFTLTVKSDQENIQLEACTITDVQYDSDSKQAVLTHTDINSYQLPVEQNITMELQFKEQETQFRYVYHLESSGELIVPEIDSVTMENGKVTVNLVDKPTIPVTREDVTLFQNLDDGSVRKETVIDFQAEGKTLTFTYPAAPKQLDAVTLSYKLSIYDAWNKTNLEQDLTLEPEALGQGTTYYVDADNGNDENSGTSPEQAWKTLDEVNSTVLYGGDSLLFKSGCTWEGQLWPKGSGTDEDHVITISSYGEGAKPRFLPGPVLTYDVNYFNTIKENEEFQIGYMIYNQEFLEISNLSLYCPGFETIDPFSTTVMRTAIQVTAKDMGQTDHIYINNMDIQGFRGEASNYGKMSGGVIYWVQTEVDEAQYRIPTWFNDVQVTNCTMQDIGRSGINQCTPWSNRQPEGEKWNGSEFYSYGYMMYGDEYLPATNAYFAHNVMQRIDGDGILLDSFKDTVVEHNLVDTFMNGSGFSAGIFPWLSEDLLIQYNEICHGKKGNDAQGCEIDALNDRVYVQYNYMHDNAGGFIQWCTLRGLPTYDSHYRYNISEHDGDNYGTLSFFDYTIGCSAYNNTVVIDGKPNFRFQNGNPSTHFSVEIYNNIFCREGEPLDLGTYFTGNTAVFNNNIFQNFEFTGETEENIGTNLLVDSKLKNPGTVGDVYAEGKDVRALREAYTLLDDSPAIGAGKPAPDLNRQDTNGGRDFFGTPIPEGNPDIGAFQHPVTSRLETIVNNSQNLNEAYYTPETWAPFADALAKAEEVLKNSEATEEERNQAAQALEDAYYNLKPADGSETDPDEEYYVDDADSKIEYAGDWKTWEQSDYYNGTVHYVENLKDGDNASYEFSFTGVGFELIQMKSKYTLPLNVYVDDVLVAENVSTSSGGDAFRQVVFSKKDLESGPHTVKVEPYLKNAPENNQFQVDAVYIIPGSEGNWGETMYEWSADYKTCTAIRKDVNDPEVVEEVTVNSTSATTEPTCTTEGSIVYTASFPADKAWAEKQTVTVTLEALGHDYQTTTVPPTETEQGYDLHTCTRCGDSYKDNFTDKLDPSVPPVPSYPISVTADHGTVTLNPKRAAAGDTVTITVTPDAGYRVERITVTSDTGKSIPLSDGRFTMPYCAVKVNVTFVETQSSNPFTDVNSGDWFYENVLWAYENGVMDGVGGGRFDPDGAVTRAMVWTVLARMDGETISGSGWMEQARTWAVAEGISDGIAADGNVTREQLATMLYRNAGEPAVSGSLDSYPDSASVSDWAVDAMIWATENGIINGTDGKLNPQCSADRAQMAAMLMRFCESILK